MMLKDHDNRSDRNAGASVTPVIVIFQHHHWISEALEPA